jgi:hypothetical protein
MNEKYCRKWQQLGQRLRKRLTEKQVRTAFNPLDGHCGWSVPLLSLREQTTLAQFAGKLPGFVRPPQFVPFSSTLLQTDGTRPTATLRAAPHAAKSMGCSTDLMASVCQPSTLRMLIWPEASNESIWSNRSQ